eukprot:12787115-Prorocentrum_lima.AAC.1
MEPGYNWQWWEQLFLWFRDNLAAREDIMAVMDSYQEVWVKPGGWQHRMKAMESHWRLRDHQA